LRLNLDDYTGSDRDDVIENGVNNGESWCLFDDKEQGVEYGARDRPGSRFYRSICINGKEIVDECADYRKEWCVDGPVEVITRNENKEEQRIFHEARCRENRWDSCIDSCNTLKSVDSADSGKLQEAFKNDVECCFNTDVRDCRWIGPGGAKQVKPFGAGKFGPYCVPQVKPGFKTWEQEGSNTCGKANLECEAAFRCPGVSRLLGMGDLKALLEKTREAIDEEQADKLGKRMLGGEFNFVDLYQQMEAMSKMGPLGKVMEMIPGLGSLEMPKDLLKVQEGKLKKWQYVIDSCRKEALENPDLIERSRIERIAKGSGTTSKEVRELLKQYRLGKKVMKTVGGKAMRTKDINKLVKQFKGKIPKGLGI